MNYYNEIKQKLIDNEIYERVKDYSKERNRIITYFEIGIIICNKNNKFIVEYCSDPRILTKEYIVK